MAVPSGILTIEQNYGPALVQPVYVFSLTNSVASGGVVAPPDTNVYMTAAAGVSLANASGALLIRG